MKILTLLERRRNHDHPAQARTGAMEQLRTTADKLADLDSYFVSMTDVDKLGINPRSTYNTPIGVYTYPLKYVLSFDKLSQLPFAGTSQHVWVIKATMPVLFLPEYKNLESDIKKITEFIKVKIPNIDDEGIDYIISTSSYYRNPTQGQSIWNICRRASGEIARRSTRARDNLQSAMPSSVMFNYILNSVLGYPIVNDTNGTIHPAEKTQCVFLRPNSYKVVSQVTNDEPTKEQSIYRLYTTLYRDSLELDYIEIPTRGFSDDACEVVGVAIGASEYGDGSNAKDQIPLTMFDVPKYVGNINPRVIRLLGSSKYKEHLYNNINARVGELVKSEMNVEQAIEKVEKNSFVKQYLQANSELKARIIKNWTGRE